MKTPEYEEKLRLNSIFSACKGKQTFTLTRYDVVRQILFNYVEFLRYYFGRSLQSSTIQKFSDCAFV